VVGRIGLARTLWRARPNNCGVQIDDEIKFGRLLDW
jgi:hypothetical protein